MIAFVGCSCSQQTPALVQPGPTIEQRVARAAPGDLLDEVFQEGTSQQKVLAANQHVSQGAYLGVKRRTDVVFAVDALGLAALDGVWAQLEQSVFPAAHVAYRAALLCYHIGDFHKARVWLRRVSTDLGLVAKAQRMTTQIDKMTRVDPAMIAVLLPLSGRFGMLGRETLSAIQLAGQQFPALRFEVIDTKGSEAQAKLAAEQAVLQHHPVAILGPIGVAETRAAARVAVGAGVPLVALSPGQSELSDATGVFYLWSSPEWEAAQAVRLATDLGYDRFAVLVPRDEQGASVAQAFRNAAASVGATVVRAGSYEPTATNLEPDMKAFLGLDPVTNRRLRRHLAKFGRKNGWKTFSPDIDFEVLYVPDRYDRASLVASYFPYFNVELRSGDFVDLDRLKRKHKGRVPQIVQLIGSSGWHHPSVLQRGGVAVEGALLVDVFVGGPSQEYAYEASAVFAQSFERRFSRQPSSVAAQAFDAASMVFASMHALPSKSPRSYFLQMLARARLGQGACGPSHVTSTGTMARRAVVLRIDGGEFVLHEY